MSHAASQVQIAIDESIRENRTVVLSAAVDTALWVELAAELDARSDDYAEEGDAVGDLRDYWGEDDGDAWRIRLQGQAPGIKLGDRVEGGVGEDHDAGRVESIDGDVAVVSWDSGVRTRAALSKLRIEA